MKEHRYEATVRWTGAREGTTSSYRAYSREHEAVVEGKPILRLSAGGAFLGDDAKHSAEDLLVIALSGCSSAEGFSDTVCRLAQTALRKRCPRTHAAGIVSYDTTGRYCGSQRV